MGKEGQKNTDEECCKGKAVGGVTTSANDIAGLTASSPGGGAGSSDEGGGSGSVHSRKGSAASVGLKK